MTHMLAAASPRKMSDRDAAGRAWVRALEERDPLATVGAVSANDPEPQVFVRLDAEPFDRPGASMTGPAESR